MLVPPALSRWSSPATEILAVRIATYHVQNLFDGRDDGGEWAEFSVARGTWGAAHFAPKLDRLVRVLPGLDADILLLQEAEGITAARAVWPRRYPYVVAPPWHGRGPGLAVLSRFPFTAVAVHEVARSDGPETLHRPILEVRLRIGRYELTLFNNHWPSQRASAERSRPERAAAASVVAARVHALTRDDPAAEIVLGGDLNKDYDQRLPPTTIGAATLEVTASECVAEACRSAFGPLYSAWLAESPAPPGSYLFRNEWRRLDHLLLSPALLDSRRLACGTNSFCVCAEPPATTIDGKPAGLNWWDRDRLLSAPPIIYP